LVTGDGNGTTTIGVKRGGKGFPPSLQGRELTRLATASKLVTLTFDAGASADGVATLPWRPFAGRAGMCDRVLWQDPTGKSYAGLLHMDPGTSVPFHIDPRGTHHLWVVSGSCTIDGRILEAGPTWSSPPAGSTASRRSDGPAACCSTWTSTRSRPTGRRELPAGGQQP
jgi:hypothetical protein